MHAPQFGSQSGVWPGNRFAGSLIPKDIPHAPQIPIFTTNNLITFIFYYLNIKYYTEIN